MRGLSARVLRAAPAVAVGGDAEGGVAHGKSAWLVRLRWMALLAQVACAFLGMRYGLLAKAQVPSYVAIVSGLFAFNVATHLMLTRRPAWASTRSLFLQMAIDVVALSALLSVTGGCFNPLFALIYLHAALGPLILGVRWSKAYLALTVSCLAFVCIGSDVPVDHAAHGYVLPRELRLAAELLVVVVIWFLTHWFSGSVGRMRAEMERLQRQQQRTDHLRALGAMAASFSHEFSTPLNTAKIRSERLARRHPDIAHDADFRASHSALDQCEATLRELFDSDQSAFAARFDDIDLVSFVRRVCERWQAGRGDLSLSVSAGRSDVSCKAPQVVLAKSLVDLLDNAAEASRGGSHPIEVEIAASGDHATVSVADRGTGVPPSIKSRLGDPFISTKPGGVGLGLYSANALMEALGGFLKIESRERGGTIITLSIPIESGALA